MVCESRFASSYQQVDQKAGLRAPQSRRVSEETYSSTAGGHNDGCHCKDPWLEDREARSKVELGLCLVMT